MTRNPHAIRYLPRLRYGEDVAVRILVGMFGCELDARRRLAPQMFLLFLATRLRVELRPDIPLVQRRRQVVERSVMLAHRTEHRRNEQVPSDERERGRVTKLHSLFLTLS